MVISCGEFPPGTRNHLLSGPLRHSGLLLVLGNIASPVFVARRSSFVRRLSVVCECAYEALCDPTAKSSLRSAVGSSKCRHRGLAIASTASRASARARPSDNHHDLPHVVLFDVKRLGTTQHLNHRVPTGRGTISGTFPSTSGTTPNSPAEVPTEVPTAQAES